MTLIGAPGRLEPPTFWCWVIGPCLFYAVERTIRILRGSQDTILLLAVAHPSKVLELQMKKNSFKYKSGQYLFLNCPYIAKYEWHPFTITSAPEEDYVSVHIRVKNYFLRFSLFYLKCNLDCWRLDWRFVEFFES